MCGQLWDSITHSYLDKGLPARQASISLLVGSLALSRSMSSTSHPLPAGRSVWRPGSWAAAPDRAQQRSSLRRSHCSVRRSQQDLILWFDHDRMAALA